MSTGNGSGGKVRAEDVFEVKRVRVEVDVPLDEAMVEHRGMRAAQLQGTVELMEYEIKADKEVVKAKEKRRDDIQAEIRELHRQIREHSGKAMVDAEERANFSTNQVDTIVTAGPSYGLVVSTRAMSPEERQLAIDVAPPEDAPVVKTPKRKPKADSAGAPH